MKEQTQIFLPGGFKLLRELKRRFNFSDRNILILGAGSQKIAEKMLTSGAKNVKIIVNDIDSFMNLKLNIQTKEVDVKMMEFKNTDFLDNEFDLVYAQASISSSKRNKIIKEIHRILKKDGILCVGEITSLPKNYPQFVKDIFNSSDILPLNQNEVENYYKDRGFEVIHQLDISSSLKSFYESAAKELKEKITSLSDQERSYFKKMLNKISHESNAYLNLGADKYIGYKMLILKLGGSAS